MQVVGKEPKTIKTTVAVLQQQGGYFDTLFNVANQVFPAKVAYAANKNINYCQSVFNAFNHRKAEYLKQYAVWEKDAKTGQEKPKMIKSMVKVGDKEEERDTIAFTSPEAEIEYKKNMDRLFGEDLFTLSVHQVDDKYLDTEDCQPFAPAIMQVLQPMFYSTTSDPDPMPVSTTPDPNAVVPTGEPGVPA